MDWYRPESEAPSKCRRCHHQFRDGRGKAWRTIPAVIKLKSNHGILAQIEQFQLLLSWSPIMEYWLSTSNSGCYQAKVQLRNSIFGRVCPSSRLFREYPTSVSHYTCAITYYACCCIFFVLFTELLPSSDCLGQEHECPLLTANYCPEDMAYPYLRRIIRRLADQVPTRRRVFATRQACSDGR